MRTYSRFVAALGTVAFALVLVLGGPAHADDYGGGTPPAAGSTDTTTPAASVGGSTATTTPDGASVLGADTSRSASGGSLPVTGADLVGATAIGAGCIGVGVVLRRRGKAKAAQQTAA